MEVGSGVDDVQIAIEFGANEQGVVFGSFGEHSVATVGANEVQAAGGLSEKSVQGGGRFREGDDVDVPIFVLIQDGGFVHAQTNDGQVTGAIAKVKAGDQGDGVVIERWGAIGRGGVGVHANPVLVTREDVRLAVAVVIPQQAPILHGWPTVGPVPSHGQGAFRVVAIGDAFKHKHTAAVSVKRKHIVVTVQIGIDEGPLWRRQPADPRVEQGRVSMHHLKICSSKFGRHPLSPSGQP